MYIPAWSSQHDEHLTGIENAFKVAQNIDAYHLSEPSFTLAPIEQLQPGIDKGHLVISPRTISKDIEVAESNTGAALWIAIGVPGHLQHIANPFQ